MIVKEIQLPEYGVLEMILHSPSEELNTAYATKRPAMIICPGGAYAFCSAREADPPAIAFLNMGFQVFLLRYPVGKMAGEKRPLFALASAIKLVREYADEWQTDPNRIAVIGFSAGGHLAASLGVHWNDPLLAEYCNVQDGHILRPDAMILAYPVITAGTYAHRESIETVSRGCRESNYWSLETQVDEQTPPTFLWHTMDDGCVPVENSFLFAESLHMFGFDMITANKFTTAQIDKNTWSEEMLDLLMEFIKTDPRAEKYRGLDWSHEYDLARNGDPTDTQSAL